MDISRELIALLDETLSLEGRAAALVPDTPFKEPFPSSIRWQS